MILVFGSINMDLVARVRAIARPGETVLAPRADQFFGGKGANQAVAAARAGGPGGAPVAMAGAVGADAFGEACLANLRANGVDVAVVRRGADPTGCAFIAVDERGENAITVASGANLAVTAASVADDVLGRAALLVLQMEVPVTESLAVARRARGNGARIVWNLAPAPGPAERDLLPALLAATDVLVVNQHEALATAAIAGGEAGDHAGAAAFLARAHRLTCVVTAGEAGATAIAPDGARLVATAMKIAPVDTTGAGDTFVGVLARGLVDGQDLGAAMAQASVAASLSCLVPGAQAGMPDAAAIRRHLAAAIR
jgi:ribokinase